MPSIDYSKCVLVTGATSGIGRSLALDIAKLPSHPQVIAAGRRKERLDELAQVDNIFPVALDVASDLSTLKKAVDDVVLDTVIFNAGIQHQLDFTKEVDLTKMLDEVTVNYTSIVASITYLLPHFRALSEQGNPCLIVIVTSGLGIIPSPLLINYSATKAALRSFCTSLRLQLKDTHIDVLEIIPPLVESELHDPYGTSQQLSKFWMPLDEFTKTTMEGLREGKLHITAGSSTVNFERYEKDKEAEIFKRAAARAGK
ncbi:hypothetical protein D9619_003041 [Psilocybe cf. subviscida]|uniref:NAD(P)-binding protein n=1 Tax=Psilocybe cf. subviscida TaxID=2480587 RepID=A0A8H5AW87_9AGAR|nr:hypothetical protein D9619_003041 [Psilocybe cf. subviscida]